ncbi:MAG: YHS domain-containing protein [Acidobacteriota bacterium]
MRFVIRFIFFLILVYIGWLILKQIFFPERKEKVRKHIRERREMVKDEVCNTYLPKEDAIHKVINGKDYYFCSDECKDKFLFKVSSRLPLL